MDAGLRYALAHPRHPAFPGSIRDAVFQPGQKFTKALAIHGDIYSQNDDEPVNHCMV